MVVFLFAVAAIDLLFAATLRLAGPLDSDATRIGLGAMTLLGALASALVIRSRARGAFAFGSVLSFWLKQFRSFERLAAMTPWMARGGGSASTGPSVCPLGVATATFAGCGAASGGSSCATLVLGSATGAISTGGASARLHAKSRTRTSANLIAWR